MSSGRLSDHDFCQYLNISRTVNLPSFFFIIIIFIIIFTKNLVVFFSRAEELHKTCIYLKAKILFHYNVVIVVYKKDVD